MKELTFARAVKGLEKAVKKEGAYHTANCYLWDKFTETPICIVGFVYDDFVGREKMIEKEPTGTVSVPAAELGIALTEDARKVLALAQEYQDGALTEIRVHDRGYTQYKSGTKNPWGDAVAYAKAYWATHESFR